MAITLNHGFNFFAARDSKGPKPCKVSVEAQRDPKTGELRAVATKSHRGGVCKEVRLKIEYEKEHPKVCDPEGTPEEQEVCCHARPEQHDYASDLAKLNKLHPRDYPKSYITDAQTYLKQYGSDLRDKDQLRSGACYDLKQLPEEEQHKVLKDLLKDTPTNGYVTPVHFISSVMHDFLSSQLDSLGRVEDLPNYLKAASPMEKLMNFTLVSIRIVFASRGSKLSKLSHRDQISIYKTMDPTANGKSSLVDTDGDKVVDAQDDFPLYPGFNTDQDQDGVPARLDLDDENPSLWHGLKDGESKTLRGPQGKDIIFHVKREGEKLIVTFPLAFKIDPKLKDDFQKNWPEIKTRIEEQLNQSLKVQDIKFELSQDTQAATKINISPNQKYRFKLNSSNSEDLLKLSEIPWKEWPEYLLTGDHTTDLVYRIMTYFTAGVEGIPQKSYLFDQDFLFRSGRIALTKKDDFMRYPSSQATINPEDIKIPLAVALAPRRAKAEIKKYRNPTPLKPAITIHLQNEVTRATFTSVSEPIENQTKKQKDLLESRDGPIEKNKILEEELSKLKKSRK